MFKKYSIDCVPKAANKLDYLIIKGKDRIRKQKKNNVVHKVNCKDCGVSYIGQTKRSFMIRKSEYKKQK